MSYAKLDMVIHWLKKGWVYHGKWLAGISQFALIAAIGYLNEDESCPMNLTL